MASSPSACQNPTNTSQLTSRGAERGLVAAAPAARGDTLFRVPFSLALMLDGDDGSKPHAWPRRLVRLLLGEVAKGPASFWHPFLAIFPRAVPLPWAHLPPDLYGEIQFQPTVRRVQRMVEYAWKHFEQLLAEEAQTGASGDAPPVAWADFVWGLSMVHTRHYSLSIPLECAPAAHILDFLTPSLDWKDGSPGPWRRMFLPVADLLNHGSDNLVDWHSGGLFHDRLELRALTDVAAGEQVHAKYGEVCNENFFVHYGFVPERNAFNHVPLFDSPREAAEWFILSEGIMSSLKENDGVLAKLMAVAEEASRTALDEAGIQDPYRRAFDMSEENRAPLDDQHDPSPRVYADLGVDMHLMAMFAAIWVASQGDTMAGASAAAVTAAAQAHARDAVTRRCEELLAACPTSIAEDRAVLASGDIAASLRSGDKEPKERWCPAGDDVGAGRDDGGGDGGGGSCKWLSEDSREAVLLAVRFRLSQKLVLSYFAAAAASAKASS
eukprot:SM000257S08641  [mRNA]  locus=s257:3394:6507:- [translate_table: standard]